MTGGGAGKLLFDDSDNEEEEEQQQFQINSKYAKEYQSRKQREELKASVVQHDNNDDGSSSSSSSSSSDEDEDGNLLWSPSMDVSILKTINALRNKDESIYDPSTQFFPDSESSAGSGDDQQDVPNDVEKRKKKRFKDVLREQILEQMEEESNALSTDGNNNNNNDDDDEMENGRTMEETTTTTRRLEYDQEQKTLRTAFLESTKDDDDDNDDDEKDEDDWMVVKKKSKDEDVVQVDEEMQKQLEALEQSASAHPLRDPRGEVEDGDKFLLDFIKNKKWMDQHESSEDRDDSDDEEEDAAGEQKSQGHNSTVDSDTDESLEQLDRTDDFESKYNFRFEEAQEAVGASGADFSVVAYARSGTMNTLRRSDDTRKRKRLERKERKAAERRAKEEQLRRLKNAKREELEAKLKQIKSVLGEVENRGASVDEATMLKLIEGDYDPDTFEQTMKEAYGDDFYAKEDAEWKTDADVRESLLQDEDGELLVGQDDFEGGLYDNQDALVDEDHVDAGDESEAGTADEGQPYEDDDAPFVQGEEETEIEKKLKAKMQEELYKLDYEDIVAGMPTRFKYRKVEPNSYGLSTEEILFAKDSTLKSFVSLKKMAPYREEGEYFVGSKKRRRFREFLKQDMEEATEYEKPAQNEQQQPTDAPLKKKRRRQKKGRKKDKANDNEDDAKAQQEKEIESDGVRDGEESAEKRRRKKKGKKLKKEETEDDDGFCLNKAADKSFETARKNANGHTPNQNDSIKKRKKHGKHSKSKKTKKQLVVEGMTASRLSSYGL